MWTKTSKRQRAGDRRRPIPQFRSGIGYCTFQFLFVDLIQIVCEIHTFLLIFKLPQNQALVEDVNTRRLLRGSLPADYNAYNVFL